MLKIQPLCRAFCPFRQLFFLLKSSRFRVSLCRCRTCPNFERVCPAFAGIVRRLWCVWPSNILRICDFASEVSYCVASHVSCLHCAEITTARRVFTPNRDGAECIEAEAYPLMSRRRVADHFDVHECILLAVEWQHTTRDGQYASLKIGVACRFVLAMDPAQVGWLDKARASPAARDRSI